MFPVIRLRRIRQNEKLRKIVRESSLQINNLVYPLFVAEGKNIKNPVISMPGIYQLSCDNLLKEVEGAIKVGIPAVLLFGIPGQKDESGTQAYSDQGVVQNAVRAIKKNFPDIAVITDVCLCEFTIHGHCGVINSDGEVLNDPTLELLAKIAVSHAYAGADMVAPSAMMDGMVGSIRKALDANSFINIPIMAYSAKYASAFYGPFREAAGSAPRFGNRLGYQMDIANSDEAVRETRLDIEEGADIVMVKPALAYLDIIRRIKELGYPVAAYNVSGEYSMVKAAAMRGWIDERKVIEEILLSIKRAGANIIITYFAKEVAGWIKKDVENVAEGGL
ncbi:MAG: porphobilinogen synthase [Actinobacteria bacterium]|nr:porphobilinogen synthase [Actinomycetota bacterium]